MNTGDKILFFRSISFLKSKKKLIVGFFLVFCILFSSYFISPIFIGDANEYLGITVSFYNHLSPDLTTEDIQYRDVIYQKNNFTFPSPYSGYLLTYEANYQAVHFWVYSLLCYPAFWIIHIFKKNEFFSFPITNILLLLSCGIIFLIYDKEIKKKNLWYTLLVIFSPILLYIPWIHPELFSYCFVALSIFFAFLCERKNYYLASFCSSIASLQNPPIIILTLFIILYKWKESEWKLNILIPLLLISGITVLPYLSNLYYFHTLNPQIILGATSLSYVTLDKIWGLFFDLNYGLLPYLPIAVGTSLFLFGYSLLKREIFIPSIWGIMILMAAFCSTNGNWNSSMMYILRYGVWMIPLIFLILIYGLESLKSRDFNIIMLIMLISTSYVVSANLIEYNRSNYLQFNEISKDVMVFYPSLYNPNPEVFGERAIGKEGYYEDRLPIIVVYNNQPRKIFTSRGNIKFLKDSNILLNTHDFNQIENAGIGYINYEPLIEYIMFDKNKFSLFSHKESTNDIFKEKIQFIDYTTSWYALELWQSIPSRWLNNDGKILIYTNETKNVTLSFNVASFYKPRTLEIFNGDSIQGKELIPGHMVLIKKKIHVNKGFNVIRFHVPDGQDTLHDLPKDLTSWRILNLGFQNITLEETLQ